MPPTPSSMRAVWLFRPKTCRPSMPRFKPLAESPDLRAVLGAAGRRHAVQHMARKDILPRAEDELLGLTEHPLSSSSKLEAIKLKIRPMEAKR